MKRYLWRRLVAVTLKDIARECGLAVSTVSNILNHNQSSYASDEVKRRVHETAERLGYRKNYLSRSLRTRTTMSVGLVLDKIDDPTRQEFLIPFVERLLAHGYEVALAEHLHQPQRALAALEGFHHRCKDAVVLFTDLLGQPVEAQEGLGEAVAAFDGKVLGIGSRLRGVLPCLDIDRGSAVDRTMAYFLGQGHRNILLAYEYEWDLRPRFSYAGHPALTLWDGIHGIGDFLARVDKADGEPGGFGRFDALMFRCDRIAIPALDYFQRRGLVIPRDLEVVSFDNYDFSAFTRPSLSTWDIGFGAVAHRAADLLLEWLGGTEITSGLYELFTPTFVGRQSHKGALI